MTDYVVTRSGAVIPYYDWLTNSLYGTRRDRAFPYGRYSIYGADSPDGIYSYSPYGGLGADEDSLSRVAEGGKRRLAQAFASNLAKIRLGELAQTNGRSEGVRHLGTLLVESHVALNHKARLLAYELRMMPPMGPELETGQVCERVSKLEKECFDSEFLRIAIAAHEKSLKTFLQREFSYYQPLVSQTIMALQKQLAIARFLVELTREGQTLH